MAQENVPATASKTLAGRPRGLLVLLLSDPAGEDARDDGALSSELKSLEPGSMRSVVDSNPEGGSDDIFFSFLLFCFRFVLDKLSAVLQPVINQRKCFSFSEPTDPIANTMQRAAGSVSAVDQPFCSCETPSRVERRIGD